MREYTTSCKCGQKLSFEKPLLNTWTNCPTCGESILLKHRIALWRKILVALGVVFSGLTVLFVIGLNTIPEDASTPSPVPSAPKIDLKEYHRIWTSEKSFKVVDVLDDGCRITLQDEPEEDMFVFGMTGYYSDRHYRANLIAKLRRPFTYRTVSGGSRTIPAYDVLPERLEAQWQKLHEPNTRR